MIDPRDRGFTLGDGLFETLLAEAGEIRHASEHLDRLDAGCAVLGLPAPDRALVDRRMRAALADLGDTRAAVRLSWSAGRGGRGLERPEVLEPVLTVTAAPAPAPDGPAKLMVSTVRRNEHSPAARLKTLAYLDNVLARREAQAAGCDEAVMLNTAGEVACAAAANLFWIADERIYTPHLDCGVLAGVVRGQVIAEAARRGEPVRAVRAGREVLKTADAAFLTNSLIGLRPVFSIEGRKLAVSPLVGELAAGLR